MDIDDNANLNNSSFSGSPSSNLNTPQREIFPTADFMIFNNGASPLFKSPINKSIVTKQNFSIFNDQSANNSKELSSPSPSSPQKKQLPQYAALINLKNKLISKAAATPGKNFQNPQERIKRIKQTFRDIYHILPYVKNEKIQKIFVFKPETKTFSILCSSQNTKQKTSKLVPVSSAQTFEQLYKNLLGTPSKPIR